MRIITGSAKGCKLKTPPGVTTRPTSDRVKEAMFSILGSDVGGRVLDIFAGTGGLGLEALSRGAESCVFVDKATADIIGYNAAHTKLSDQCRILKGDVFGQLARLVGEGAQFDLVFCDPPYHQGLAQRALAILDESPILAPQAIVVMEHGGEDDDLPETKRLRLVRNPHYGRMTQLSFYVLE